MCALHFLSDTLCGVNGGFSYYNGYCYKAYDGDGNQGKTWRQARAQCQQTGGDLASIMSLQEQQFLYQRLVSVNKNHISAEFKNTIKVHCIYDHKRETL